jgi:hypothetical protein
LPIETGTLFPDFQQKLKGHHLPDLRFKVGLCYCIYKVKSYYTVAEASKRGKDTLMIGKQLHFLHLIEKDLTDN